MNWILKDKRHLPAGKEGEGARLFANPYALKGEPHRLDRCEAGLRQEPQILSAGACLLDASDWYPLAESGMQEWSAGLAPSPATFKELCGLVQNLGFPNHKLE